jgi:hypothetical protein
MREETATDGERKTTHWALKRQELFLEPRYVKFSVNKISGKKRERTENGKLCTHNPVHV